MLGVFLKNPRQFGSIQFSLNGIKGKLRGISPPHDGGKQLFLFSPQGPENGGEIKFSPPRVRKMGGKNLQNFSAPAAG